MGRMHLLRFVHLVSFEGKIGVLVWDILSNYLDINYKETNVHDNLATAVREVRVGC